MSALRFLRRPSVAVLAIAMATTTLTACKPDVTASPSDAQAQTTSLALPLTTGTTQPITTAPPLDALPAAPRPRIVRVNSPADTYAYVEQAYAMSDAIGQAPPDYGFSYADAHPWVWRSHGSDMRIVEPVSGGDRYYFYQSGASDPYLVRDPQYAYAYSDGQLVMVFDRQGRPLSPEEIDQLVDGSGRYLMRGRALRAAAMQDQREQVNAANWAARRAEIAAVHAQWAADEARSDDWRAYHAEHEAEEQAYWQGERAGRQQAAQNFEHWRDQRYEGPPPPVQAYDRGPSESHNNLVGPAVVVAAIAGALALNHKHKDDHAAPANGPTHGPALPHPNAPGPNQPSTQPPFHAATPTPQVAPQVAPQVTPQPHTGPYRPTQGNDPGHQSRPQTDTKPQHQAPVPPQAPHPTPVVREATPPSQQPQPHTRMIAPVDRHNTPPQPHAQAWKTPTPLAKPAPPIPVKTPAKTPVKAAPPPHTKPAPNPQPKPPQGADHGHQDQRSQDQKSHEPHGT